MMVHCTCHTARKAKLSRDNHANFAVLRMMDGTELWRDYDVSYVDSDADAEVTEYVFLDGIRGCCRLYTYR